MAKREGAGLLNIIGSLSGTAWKLLVNYPTEDIEKSGAFEKILKILDKAFENDKTVQLPSDFTHVVASPSWSTPLSMTISTISSLTTLPEKVQGWHLLRRAGLTKEQGQLVTAQAPSMERNQVQEAIFLILGQDHKTVAGGGQHPHHRGFRGKGRAYAAYYEGADFDPDMDEWPDDDGWEER
jgi:hypothetical protein